MKTKAWDYLLLELELAEVVVFPVHSVGGSTLSSWTPVCCLPTAEPVNSSRGMRRAIWAGGAERGSICSRNTNPLHMSYRIRFNHSFFVVVFFNLVVIWIVLPTSFGSGSICRSLILGVHAMGIAMLVEGLEEDGKDTWGKILDVCGSGWKCSRRRPWVGRGLVAGTTRGSKRTSCLLDLSKKGSDIWSWGRKFLAAGSRGGLVYKATLCCLLGTEDSRLFSSSAHFGVAWSYGLSLAWGGLFSVWSPQASGTGGQWDELWGGSGFSNFSPTTWGAGILCVLTLVGSTKGAVGIGWLGPTMVRSPWEHGIDLLLSPNRLSGDSACTDNGCISCRKDKNLFNFLFTLISQCMYQATCNI